MNAEQFSEAMSQLDSRYVEEALFYPSKMRGKRSSRRLPFVLAAAISALILLGCVAAATGVFGTQLLNLFTSRAEPGADYKESGYDLSVAVSKIPMAALTGAVGEVEDEIRQQMQEYELYQSWFPGHWQSDFASRGEACAYIGLASLTPIGWGLEEQSTTLNVYGNEKGEISSLQLETDYVVGEIRAQFFSWIFTENFEGEITTGSRTTEDVEYAESFYVTDGNKECHILQSSALESGYKGLDGYVVVGGVLQHFHLAYLEKDADRAMQLMYRWADSF